mgnify:CR=1 FL=1
MNNKNVNLSGQKKEKILPILSLSKLKINKGKESPNKSVHSLSSSDFNSLSYSSRKKKKSVKNSYSNSDKSVKPYKAYITNANRINRTQNNSEAKFKKSFLTNLSNVKNSNKRERERLSNLYDNKNLLILNQKKSAYQKTYMSNKGNLFKNPLYKKDFKLNNIFYSRKKLALPKKIGHSILKNFESDFHNFYINSLKNTKDEFQKKIDKINKTFYKAQIPLTKNEQLNNIINKNIELEKMQNNLEDMQYNSNIDDESYMPDQDSTFRSKSKNNLENKLIKTHYSSQQFKLDKNYKRKRNFKQYMDEKMILEKKWKSKLGLIESNVKYNPLLLNDLQFQSGIIKDEMCLLIDDIQHFRLTFFEDSNLISAFKNKDMSYQIRLNKIVEETCVLLHFIPKIILKEYYSYTDKFISIVDPSREYFSKKIINNEAECFQENLKYLYRILNFVKCCNEVYSQLISQVEDEMIITLQNFQLLKSVLEKIRHNMINLTNISKNILKDYIFDKNIIAKCKVVIKKTKEEIKNIKNEKSDNESKDKKYKYYDYSDFSDNESNKNYNEEGNNEEFNIKKKDDEDIMDQKITKITENYLGQKINRITKALEANSSSAKKTNKKALDNFKEKQARMAMNGISGPMALINSPLMTKMLKYIKKDCKKQIISLRTSQRYLENN